MSTPFSGGCACGAIRYECFAEPIASLNCHCRDCQRASGSAFAAILIVPAAALSLDGKPTYYDVTADSGNTMSRGFCRQCGSPVVIQHRRTTPGPGGAILHAASLDDPSWFRPTMDIYTSRAQPWDCMNPALSKFEEEPKG